MSEALVAALSGINTSPPLEARPSVTTIPRQRQTEITRAHRPNLAGAYARNNLDDCDATIVTIADRRTAALAEIHLAARRTGSNQYLPANGYRPDLPPIDPRALVIVPSFGRCAERMDLLLPYGRFTAEVSAPAGTPAEMADYANLLAEIGRVLEPLQ